MQKLIYLYCKDLDSLFLKRAKVTNNDASVCVGKPMSERFRLQIPLNAVSVFSTVGQ